MSETKSANKLHFLDSLRGIAALVVVLGHFHIAFGMKHYTKGVKDIISIFTTYTILYGSFAVCLFFVLSGFVLSVHYFKSYSNEILIKQSIKRYPRLFLPVLVTSFIYWLVQRFGFFQNLEVVKITSSEWFSGFWIHSYTFKQLVLRCGYDLMFFNEQTFCNNINTSLWTMPIELKYSFLLFASLFVIRNMSHLWLYNLVILALIFIWKDSNFIFYFAFMLGINIAYFYVNMPQKEISKTRFYVLLIFSAIIGTLPFQSLIVNADMGTIMRCISASFIIYLALYYKPLQNFLTHKVLLFLGEMSFSLYLIHALVLGTVSSYIFLYLHNLGIHYQINYGISLLVTIAFSIFLGKIVHQFIDVPSIKISNFVYNTYNSIRNKVFFNK